MDGLRLADGGLETSLVFEHGLDLPHFAAFPLLEDDAGRTLLWDYWQPFLVLAEEHDAGFDVDTATWRANHDWAARLGYDVAMTQGSTNGPRGSPAGWPTAPATVGSTGWSDPAETGTSSVT